MRFEPSRFTLSKSPLALVLAQFTLRHPVGGAALDTLRAPLRLLGLERLTKRRERTVSVGPASLSPNVQDRDIWIVLDRKGTRGVSLADDAFLYFTGSHSSFARFVDDLSELAESLAGIGLPFDVTSIALRYVNVFDIENDPTTVVKASLGGLDRTNLGKDHHHHNYEFWCETQHGRLHVRFSTTHGDRKPAQLGHAEAAYPSERLRSYDETVGHLDIFETTRKVGPSANWEATRAILQTMNLNIEQAFLNAIDETVLIEKFGAREK